MKNLSRRKFIKFFSGGAIGLSQIGTIELLFSAFLSNKYNIAMADELNLADYIHYLHFSFRGGPPRWQWDLPLTPLGKFEGFNPNPYCVTKFIQNENQELEYLYETHAYSGYHVPYLWKTKIPTTGGGKIEMDSLLQNMLMFRGLNNTSDGHGLNRVKMNQPIPGGLSLTGVAADASSFPIPAVHFGPDTGFMSKKGTNSVAVSGNLFLSLLDGLNLKYRESEISGLGFGKESKKDVSNRLDKVLDLFNVNHRQVASVSHRDLKNAKSLFLREFGDLDAMYKQFVDKYNNLIYRSFAEHDLVGFDSTPVIASDSKLCQHSHNRGTRLHPGVDMRDLFVSTEGQTLGQASLNVPSSQKATNISNLAASMALAEFCLANNLATSLMLPVDGVNNLYLPKKTDTENPNWIARVSAPNDSHWTGSHLSNLLYGKYFKAVSACTHELKTVLINLKNKNNGKSKWDHTLLHFSAEFPRAPDKNGHQNGHAWDGNCISLMSGKIKKLDIIGSCLEHSSKGHYGVGAKLKSLSGRKMHIGNIASSVATILGVASPTPNDASLVGLDKDGNVINFGGKPDDSSKS